MRTHPANAAETVVDSAAWDVKRGYAATFS
jgi:hypothetical protein